ncbi:hypothetical protein [Nonlabens antarcticus]|uniref:hypothetical protein n=1 Tax=Nonlabens antarcticus TaxID=392714 RepID=UPI0018915ECD|nr:hypothetical protein [Nonlabens antarcticus]
MKKKNTHKNLGFEIPDGYFESNMDRMFDFKVQPSEQHKLPFAAPVGYFENLEQRIFENTCDPKAEFSAADQELPFKVPEDYFKNLEQHVLNQTVDKPVVQLKRDYPAWVIPMLAVAAIFIAVVTINGLWQSNSFSMEDLNNDELGLYLADTDFRSDQDVINILYSDSDDLKNVAFSNAIDNDDLLDYLVDEVDMNLMMEE